MTFSVPLPVYYRGHYKVTYEHTDEEVHRARSGWDLSTAAAVACGVENFSFEISKMLNIASIQPFIAIPSQCRKAKKEIKCQNRSYNCL